MDRTHRRNRSGSRIATEDTVMLAAQRAPRRTEFSEPEQQAIGQGLKPALRSTARVDRRRRTALHRHPQAARQGISTRHTFSGSFTSSAATATRRSNSSEPHWSSIMRRRDAYNNHGRVLLQLKRHDEALLSIERALALAPNHPQALINRSSHSHRSAPVRGCADGRLRASWKRTPAISRL